MLEKFNTHTTTAVQSGSLAVIASALDSFLDLLSGSIIFLTNWLKNKLVYFSPVLLLLS
jgi:hypothetical protein